MVFFVTIGAGLIALVLHVLRVPLFGDIVSVPVTALIAMCLVGVSGRLSPRTRRLLTAIVPCSIPNPGFVVWASAACELAAAIGLLVPVLRPWAAGALGIFLIAVFPANVRAAHLQGDRDGSFGRRLVVRGGEQVVFVALCVWALVASVAG